jgi:hypothetical protein
MLKHLRLLLVLVLFVGCGSDSGNNSLSGNDRFVGTWKSDDFYTYELKADNTFRWWTTASGEQGGQGTFTIEGSDAITFSNGNVWRTGSAPFAYTFSIDATTLTLNASHSGTIVFTRQ